MMAWGVQRNQIIISVGCKTFTCNVLDLEHFVPAVINVTHREDMLYKCMEYNQAVSG